MVRGSEHGRRRSKATSDLRRECRREETKGGETVVKRIGKVEEEEGRGVLGKAERRDEYVYQEGERERGEGAREVGERGGYM